FRLADPHIFQAYSESWRNGAGTAISLADNFRSREGILGLINSVFASVMRREVGGIEYDESSELRFGAPAERHVLSTTGVPGPCVEVHLRTKGSRKVAERAESDSEAPASGPSPLAQMLELAESDKEARLIALRLRELKAK